VGADVIAERLALGRLCEELVKQTSNTHAGLGSGLTYAFSDTAGLFLNVGDLLFRCDA
jgi:hypothetical protein